MIKESMQFTRDSELGNTVVGIYRELSAKEGNEAVVLLRRHVAEYFYLDENGLGTTRALILFNEDEPEDVASGVAYDLIPWCGQNHPKPTLHGIRVRIFGYDYDTGNYKEIMKVEDYGQINDIEKAVTEYYRKIRD